MDILITGINGFVGSNFTKEWSKRHSIWGIDLNKTAKDGVEKIWDWSDLATIQRMDAIVHLAGKAHDLKNKSLAQSYFDVNTKLTQEVFDYFLSSKCETFIFFSSVKAAADKVSGDILTEDVIPNPIGPYGESKIKAEEYILSKLPIAFERKKRVYIIRPCMIHGPGNKGNLNLLYKIVSKGIPWPLGAYENKRSFCSIDNISYVIEKIITTPNVESGIYHIADDMPISTNELIRLISEFKGKKPNIWKISKGFIELTANIGNVLHLPLNKERLSKLTENYVVSNAKIKRALAIDRMPISAQEGIKRTLKVLEIKIA